MVTGTKGGVGRKAAFSKELEDPQVVSLKAPCLTYCGLLTILTWWVGSQQMLAEGVEQTLDWWSTAERGKKVGPR